jgi:hypothetical protein
MQHIGNIDADAGGSDQDQEHVTSTADSGAEMEQITFILNSIDARHDVEMQALEQSPAEDDLKEFIRQDMQARHRTRRAPYAELLESLRQRQDKTYAA